ncbi:hypothetical protein [Sinorhizobium fredii]|uniref:hypothetical protein n=1 Tax=Rhizobium fredii TaxID=380 RepID=UPI0004B4591E|nr:hypothetical protein [Sinorhizobium fredii]
MTSQTRTELASTWPPTAAVAKAAGHERKSPMKAIREKCLDCCAGQPSEVRACESVHCALWPFRSGTHPYTSARMKNAPQEQVFEESEAA